MNSKPIIMKPINNKSLLHFLFDQMEKLDNKQIDVEQAKAQANLAKQANNSLKYELERSKILMELDSHRNYCGNQIEFRNVEGKNFD
jgi:hypothetical protein